MNKEDSSGTVILKTFEIKILFPQSAAKLHASELLVKDSFEVEKCVFSRAIVDHIG